MKRQTCLSSHEEELANELKELRRNITPNDRKEALKTLGLKDRSTLSNYLNGQVRNADLAAALIIFFKGQIHKRSLVLIDNKI